MMTVRKERHRQYLSLQTGSVSALSTWLLHSAEFELMEALSDRGPGKARSEFNHWSPHCGASVLLLASGLEAWLNETTLLLSIQHSNLRRLADCTVLQKYEKIPQTVGANTVQASQDLKLVLLVRDELAHFLPLVVSGGVPHWLAPLQNRGLLLTAESSEHDYDFAAKLNSYAVTYWAWASVHKAVRDFLDALGAAGSPVRPTAANFEGYQSVCPPSRLPEYDDKYRWRRRLGRWFGRFGVRG